MLRFDRPGLRAAARADTGVDPRVEGVRPRPLEAVEVVEAEGGRVSGRAGDPLRDESDLDGVPDVDFRGVDMSVNRQKYWVVSRVKSSELLTVSISNNSAVQ